MSTTKHLLFCAFAIGLSTGCEPVKIDTEGSSSSDTGETELTSDDGGEIDGGGETDGGGDTDGDDDGGETDGSDEGGETDGDDDGGDEDTLSCSWSDGQICVNLNEEDNETWCVEREGIPSTEACPSDATAECDIPAGESYSEPATAFYYDGFDGETDCDTWGGEYRSTAPTPGEECIEGETSGVYDCDGVCADPSLLEDGVCHDGSVDDETANFACEVFTYDRGDCDTPVLSCDATLTLELPDGTSSVIDFCAQSQMDMKYEFDPDVPPEIRSPTLTFDAIDAATDFDCNVTITEPGTCGLGYYRMGKPESTGLINLKTYDCSGVGDEFEDEFSDFSGYLRFDELHAGTVVGDLSDTPLETTVSGYIDVTSGSGIRLYGDFSIQKAIVGSDWEDAVCSVFDGDADGDGFLAADLDGTDCDDSREELGSIELDADCDGTLAEEDCDDFDADSYVKAEDADCDGLPTAEDCDDTDAGSTSILDDQDCDGFVYEEDCDDRDAFSTFVDIDADCDGILSEDDCDDEDEDSTNVFNDADCDGTTILEDCDDEDAFSTTIFNDEDCDGVLTEEDCDDLDVFSTFIAIDADCDGILTPDDCDDEDDGSTTVFNDADCDGATVLEDCDDTDPASTFIADDEDCDGAVYAEDCDDRDASSTTFATDADCDGILTADDCDDEDRDSTNRAIDADCDGIVSEDDCDDENAFVWESGEDGECIPVLVSCEFSRSCFQSYDYAEMQDWCTQYEELYDDDMFAPEPCPQGEYDWEATCDVETYTGSDILPFDYGGSSMRVFHESFDEMGTLCTDLDGEFSRFIPGSDYDGSPFGTSQIRVTTSEDFVVPGETFEVTIELEPVQPYAGWDLFLAFDTEVFTPMGGGPGDLLTSDFAVDFFFDVVDDGVFMFAFGLEDDAFFPAISGSLFTINVFVGPDARPGLYELEIPEATLVGPDFDALRLEGSNASVVVGSP